MVYGVSVLDACECVYGYISAVRVLPSVFIRTQSGVASWSSEMWSESEVETQGGRGGKGGVESTFLFALVFNWTSCLNSSLLHTESSEGRLPVLHSLSIPGGKV